MGGRRIALTVAVWLALCGVASAQGTVGIIGTQKLPPNCTNGQVPAYNTSTLVWDCATAAASGDTLPITDATAVVKGSATASKLFRIEVDGFTAATTRVFTPPDVDLTISAFIATLTDNASAAAARVTLGAAASGANGDITGLSGLTGNLDIGGSAGVRATGAAGVLTLLGLGPGFDENLILNFDAVTNTIGVSSGTGVVSFNFSGMDLSLSAGRSIYSLVNYVSPNVLSANGTVTGSVAGDMVLRVATGKSLLFTGDGGTTIHGRLNSSGFTGKFVTAGTAPTVANVGANSCGTTAATIAGNDNAFEITIGATAGTQCRVTLTTTAPVRWNCDGNNDTTVANLVSAKSVSTTQVDFYGTFVAGDVITGQCLPR